MVYTSIDNVRINYKTYGERNKKAIFLVHGFGANVDMYSRQIEAFQEDHYVIVMDVRCHGESDCVAEFKYEDVSKDIKGILDEIGIKKVLLVGVSMGGHIVMKFATSYQEYLYGLIVCDSFAGAYSLKTKLFAWLHLVNLRVVSNDKFKKLYMKTYGQLDCEELGEYFGEQLMVMDRKQLIKIRKVINRFDIKHQLAEVDINTLVLTGNAFGDWFVDLGREIARNIRNSTFKIIEGGGDPSNYVKSECFNNFVLEYSESLNHEL